ncbi:response regulator [Bacillaceae bacterium Marseille-Q3522]|nr:response regulator [Bacillaceae bacterium Marseille-Q3522]
MIRVLIVEDDPMVAEFNKKYLEEIEGYQLTGIVPTVQEAVSLLEKQKVDLILLDLFLPHTNGFDLLAHIRNNAKDIDVILITAACDMNNIHKALQNGAVDYIIKPFKFERFRDALVSYRERASLMKVQNKVSQDELDRLLQVTKSQEELHILPKGLTTNTLREIWNFIQAQHGEEFSTEEVTDAIGISRVSIRKYLSFLEEIGGLTSYSTYGSIGRPLTKFKCLHEAEQLIESYLKEGEH